FADTAREVAKLDWNPQYGLEDMFKDSWNWQKYKLTGYKR
ncbi:UDP-glucose 4-epimerase, partial [Acinetobacter variabilis]